MSLAQPIFTQVNRETAMKHPLQTARKLFLIATATGLFGVAAAPSFAGDANTKGTSLTLDPNRSTKPSTGGGQGFRQAINPSTTGLQSFGSNKSSAQKGEDQPLKSK